MVCQDARRSATNACESILTGGGFEEAPSEMRKAAASWVHRREFPETLHDGEKERTDDAVREEQWDRSDLCQTQSGTDEKPAGSKGSISIRVSLDQIEKERRDEPGTDCL